MAEDMAAADRAVSGNVERFDALIIGAGFTGLYQLHSLRDRLGLNAQVLEVADGVGGTWYWNRYPGARCDSESHSYCYYFSKELLNEWEWSERYPGQEEIRSYLNFVADRFDLRKDIRLGDRVVSARFDDAATLWHVTTEAGKRYAAPFLITGVGCLSSANVPDIPGLEDFKGDWYHTGEWPHEGVDFSGKRVGQIGTGSTGIQAAPVIAASADHLTVFQRTANYSIPARNHPLSDAFKQYAREHSDEIHKVMISNPNGHPFSIEDRLVASVSEEERQAIYEEAWEKGGLRFRAVFKDLMVDKAANDTASDFIKSKIREIVKDPKTAALLSTLDHPFGTKRPPVDTEYFETFNRDNVTLIDIKSDPIKRITETGIETENARYDLDIIVFATGFDAITGPLLRIDIAGKDELSLKDAWAAGPKTYLGLQVAGFPNLFTVTGPGSPSVLTNMPVSIEQHVDWITDCIAKMRANGQTRIEATEKAAEDWVIETNRAAEATLLPLANSSWYLGANVPGKPRVFMPYAGGLQNYRARCDAVADAGYEGFVLS
ncbi:NAD(P)/FAD-dependent oxidoreductase [Nisaea acidiphila]|uniref:NAD(P)/FAD-dependent oxidoreductase n=1 Tax=Nisaea acidiphila TaxID=1862145 RepID=A0A9J7ASV8_9PROT|nr:NAD(P)/FAD-dependent oxidoreductase [Nisaea acidiphila]UUX49946.1 NAD(P)/FAD-dependent oxidoreductase [Nisaea acidiphila]